MCLIQQECNSWCWWYNCEYSVPIGNAGFLSRKSIDVTIKYSGKVVVQFEVESNKSKEAAILLSWLVKQLKYLMNRNVLPAEVGGFYISIRQGSFSMCQSMKCFRMM